MASAPVSGWPADPACAAVPKYSCETQTELTDTKNGCKAGQVEFWAALHYWGTCTHTCMYHKAQSITTCNDRWASQPGMRADSRLSVGHKQGSIIKPIGTRTNQMTSEAVKVKDWSSCFCMRRSALHQTGDKCQAPDLLKQAWQNTRW